MSESLAADIAACRACADRFARTATAHAPRPVIRLSATARLLIAGQAPGARVHASGLPFDDASGDRLRDWLGLDRAAFYDASRVAIAPMAFCFPGYDARGADLPPPPLCARLWRARVVAAMPQVAKEDGVDQVLLFVVDILNEEATLLLPNTLVKTVAEKSFSTVCGDADTVVLPGVVSRKKQIIPVLTV